MIDTEVAAVARTYVRADLAVFPLWWPANTPTGCACPNPACQNAAKHPLTRNGVHDASIDLGVIAGWWKRWPNANIGMPADRNSLAVLDIDTDKGGRESLARLQAYLAAHHQPLSDTLTQRTGSGGWHMIFRAPEGGIKCDSNVFGPDMPGLDTRGRGGYIVVAPSIHKSGRAYRWRNFLAPLAPWPDILTRLMDPPRPAAPEVPLKRGPISDRYAEAALDGELEAVRSAVVGRRNNQLNESAFALGQLVGAGLLDEGTVRHELLAAAVLTGLDQSGAVKTILSGLRGGKARPRSRSATS